MVLYGQENPCLFEATYFSVSVYM